MDLEQKAIERIRLASDLSLKHYGKPFADFPKYKQSYIRAFERMLDTRKEKGLETQWETGEDVFRWWMDDDDLDGQMELSDFIEY
jgi:hypothetical protein